MGSSDAPAKAQNEIVAQRAHGNDGMSDRRGKADDCRTAATAKLLQKQYLDRKERTAVETKRTTLEVTPIII